jgi:hypothetical protein
MHNKLLNVESKNGTPTARIRKPKCAPIRGDFSSRLLTGKQTCQYLNKGWTTMRRFCDSIGATIKLGERCVRYDRFVIDAYLDKKAQAAVTDETA